MKSKTKKQQYPSNEDIIKTYEALGLGNMLETPFDLQNQILSLRKFSLFTDNKSYYASGVTTPN